MTTNDPRDKLDLYFIRIFCFALFLSEHSQEEHILSIFSDSRMS